MSSPLPPIPDNITDITAPQLLGTLFNWGLYGILSVQVYIYYLNFPDDKKFSKCLVYGTYLLETVQTALSGADVYYWFASGFGNMLHIDDVYVSPWDTPFLCGIIAAVVQCFFAYRIWKLKTTYWWLCILIVLTALLQTAGAFGTALRGHILHHYHRFHEDVLFPASFHVWLLGDAVSDILIAGSMLHIFYISKKEDYLLANNILAKLVRLIVETNALTASMAVLSFVLYAGLPGTNYFICTTLVMGKLYSNTLLVTFNNRIALRKTVVDGVPLYSHGSSGHAVSAFRARGNETIDSTYNIGTKSTTKPNKPENIEIEVLRNIKMHNRYSSDGSPVAV